MIKKRYFYKFPENFLHYPRNIIKYAELIKVFFEEERKHHKGCASDNILQEIS